ncbi:MAG: TMEM175 family protein [Pseudomonadota bacterium]
MIRQSLTEQLDHDPDFHWRGTQVTRIENLSDIVFALAFSMMVTASNTPFTFEGIKTYLVSLPPIAVAFAFMLGTWNRHFLFFRRYGLADNNIVWLNAMLLLTILSIALPMRFIFESLYAWMLVLFGISEVMQNIGVQDYREAGEIVAYFGVIYAVLNIIQAQMYARAMTKSRVLDLNDLELAHTTSAIWTSRLATAVGFASAFVAYFTIIGPFAGFLINLATLGNWLIDRAVIKPVRNRATANA